MAIDSDLDVIQDSRSNETFLTISLIPALVLGGYQLYLLALIQSELRDEIYMLLWHAKYYQLELSCVASTCYIVLAILNFVY